LLALQLFCQHAANRVIYTPVFKSANLDYKWVEIFTI